MRSKPIVILYFIIHICFTKDYNFEEPKYYTDLLCSFRSVTDLELAPTYDNNYKCTCREEYDSNNFDFKVNGESRQCEYEKKSRFYFLFLSITQPIGMELFYIEYYYYAIICLIYGIITIIGNFYCYFDSDEKEYFKLKRNLSFFILLVVLGLVWVFKIVYFYTSVKKDANGIELFNDVDFSDLFK
jgi:hypothetical protein